MASKEPEEADGELFLCLPSAFTLVFCSAYSSTLKMEGMCSSETSADFKRTTRRYIPEDTTLWFYSFQISIAHVCIYFYAYFTYNVIT
jgi:hypothetical protein